MGVIPSGIAHSAATGLEAKSSWQRVTQSFFALRSRLAVNASPARRSKYDIKRCHQLMSQGPNVPATPRITACRAAQTVRQA
jgi:hypothetical protein